MGDGIHRGGPPPARGVTPRRMRLLRGGLALVAVVALLFALREAVEEAGAVALPGPGRLALAGGLMAVSLVSAGSAWAVLIDVRVGRAFPGFVLAQLAKYVPGSVWQGVGQVADAHRLGVATSRASLAFVVQLLLQIIAAAAASVLALTAAGLPLWLRVWAAVAPLSLVFVDRRWLAAVVATLSRWSARLRDADLELPTQAALLAATWRSVVTIMLVGTSYAVLLPSAASPREVVGAAGVFMLAWLVGFLVVPLPAGLGVREIVLVAGLSAVHPTAEILAAAVVARLLLIVVEGALALGAQPLRLRSRSG
jgi:glycosyltransferase 2 family protein